MNEQAVSASYDRILKEAVNYLRSLIPATVLREQADSATLARGLATEQAAQECDRHAAFCKTEAENGGNVEHLLTRKAEAEYNAQRIRSLSPDAAQALAAHDAEVIRLYLAGEYTQGTRIAALAESQPAPAKEGKK